ncbi:MAG: hypothetical protein LBH49_00855 [Puniceicoccales bacterium]|jgi:hypothetical protein|nr:hypothetical protein [Puniceicoccales bacterium]
MSDFRRNKSNDLGRVGFIEGDFDSDGVLLEKTEKISNNSDERPHNSLRRGRVPRNTMRKCCNAMTSANDFVVNDTSKVMSDAISTKLHSGLSKPKRSPLVKKTTTVHDVPDDVSYSMPNINTSSHCTEKFTSCCENEISNKFRKNEMKLEYSGNSCPRAYEKVTEKKTHKNHPIGNASRGKKCGCSSFISKIMAFFGFSPAQKRSEANVVKTTEKRHNRRFKSRGSGNKKSNRIHQDFKTKEES